MTSMTSIGRQLEQDGYVVLPELIPRTSIAFIAQHLARHATGEAGNRRLLAAPWCRDLATQLVADSRLQDLGLHDTEPVQCTLFTKSPQTNWLVAFHQDLSIPVAERGDGIEFPGWSEKDGEFFVQPPVPVLQGLVALRLHLDDCSESNGALRIVPGSHRLGRLTAEAAAAARADRGEWIVPVRSGGAMLMRPLLLHASSRVALPASGGFCTSSSDQKISRHRYAGPTRIPWRSRRQGYTRDSRVDPRLRGISCVRKLCIR